MAPCAAAPGPPRSRKPPSTGPPAGKEYDTIDYGLFEPFTLQQIVEEIVRSDAVRVSSAWASAHERRVGTVSRIRLQRAGTRERATRYG